jgi:hypothetical protein
MSMSPSTAASGTSTIGDLSAAREQVRSAARWFIAGLGGIGAVLVAGSQVSSIGALAPGPRFFAALIGVALGLLAILWAIWHVVDVLAGRRWAFEDVVSEWEHAKAAIGTSATISKSVRREYPVATFFIEHPSTLSDYESPSAILQLYKESDPERKGLDDLVELMHEIVEKASTVSLSAQFRASRPRIALGVLLGAGGIILFAWAANPATDDAQPSMRNAILRGVDFKGSSLRGVDLSGADLTGANLADSDLHGAKVEETIWSGTTCPDGSNSDSRAIRKNGELVGSTCEGHLTP